METKDIHALLERHPFFAGLGEETLRFVAGCGTNVRFDEGTYVAREGQAAETFYLLRSGRVALEIAVPGRGPLVVDTVEEGEILGVSWLLPPYRWQFDVRVVELARAVSLDGACLRAKCEEDPRLGYALMLRLAGVMRRRLQSARLRLLDLYHDARTG